MPQLSPLNWSMLFVLFWLAVIIVSILIWWNNKNMFYVVQSKRCFEESKWLW